MTRITLDGFVLRFPRTGIVNYVFNILSLLNRRPGLDVTVLLEDLNFFDDKIAALVRESVRAQVVTKHIEPGRLNEIREHFRNNRLAVRLPTSKEIARVVAPGSVYHATDWYHYASPHARLNVLTYFDLTTTLHPQFHEHTNIVKERRKATEIRNFDRIVAISNSTKNDLINHFRVPAEKIRVSHLGVDSAYETPKRVSRKSLLAKYNIDPQRRYILSVSTIEPRKNIIGILNAYRVLADTAPRFRDVLLVLSGQMGWRNERLNRYLASYPYRKSIVFTGYVALEDMPGLYQHAEAFVYLSFYEGFGIPILEAMRSSCPVVSSNTSSMPEVIGECGELVSPHDPEEAAAALTRILDDGRYADSLRFAGLVRSKQFTWTKHVDDLIRIYDGA